MAACRLGPLGIANIRGRRKLFIVASGGHTHPLLKNANELDIALKSRLLTCLGRRDLVTEQLAGPGDAAVVQKFNDRVFAEFFEEVAQVIFANIEVGSDLIQGKRAVTVVLNELLDADYPGHQTALPLGEPGQAVDRSLAGKSENA